MTTRLRHLTLAAIAAALSFAPFAAAAAQPAPRCTRDDARPLEARLQGVLDSVLRAFPDVPGVALTVIAPQRCLDWSGAAGVVDTKLKAPLTPLTPRHPHRMASNTKSYVAAAVLRLVEDGKLSLDDPITKHLPASRLASLRRGGYAVERITVRQLLNHTSGIFDHTTDERYVARIQREPQHRWTREEQVDSGSSWGKPYFAPDEGWRYSDTGYVLLGEILERVTGMAMAPAVRTLVMPGRLGLASTWWETLEPKPSGVPDRVHQYMQDWDSYEVDPSFDLYGGGGLAATTEDMARFTRALLRGELFKQKSTLATMMTVTPHSEKAGMPYGAGLYRREIGGDVVWGHSGFWNTYSYHIPSRDITIAASVTQQVNRQATRALQLGVARVLAP